MKKNISAIFIGICLIAAGCANTEKNADPFSGEDSRSSMQEQGNTNDAGAADGQDAAKFVCRLRIADGAGSSTLFLAGEDIGALYTLSPGNEIPVYLDGQLAEASSLQDGMIVEIEFDGTIMETFPSMFGQVSAIYAYSQGTEQNPGGGYYDLCGFYLQVLNDLWDTDPGLNSNVEYISVDLSQAPGELTEGEKHAIAWIFASQHQAEALTLSYEELKEEGYLSEMDGSGNPELLRWENGILFTITPEECDKKETYSLPVLKFNAEKWRSPIGAYFFMDCFAVWPEMGTWTNYEIGGEAIS